MNIKTKSEENMIYDYIIVGQGIAGTLLSYFLLQRQKKVLVMNKVIESSSSRVAAGIFNPVTGKKMQKTWRADDIFPFLHQTYLDLEKLLHTRFFYPVNIYRPFLNNTEKNEWMGLSSDEGFYQYIENIYDQSEYGQYIYDKFGGLELKMSGYVDVKTLLDQYAQFLRSSGCYLESVFIEEDLNIEDEYVEYQGNRARKMIFCEGPQAHDNYLFRWLPFGLVKGEVLQVKCEQEPPLIFNRGIFVLPTHDGTCKVGATYEWNDLSSVPTQKGLETLKGKLKELYRLPFEVVGHEAGVRPSAKDRRPFLGLHPKYKTIGIFNGLGTKGISLAPFFAKHFCDFLENDTDLDSEVNINRYIPLYFH
jgi:glycine oxidase